MRRLFRLVLPGLLAFGLLVASAGATHNADQHFKMEEVFTSPNQATNSDLAFWGNHAFVGYYTGDAGFPPGTGSRGGVRIFDISNPAAPVLLKDFECNANQNDPIVWDRNGNGVADLMLLAVDRTMANPNCGAARSAHNDRNGWEAVRIFEMSAYPLRAGPTCGQANTSNVTNPHDPDKVVNDPLHRQIQVLSVPLNNPAATTCTDETANGAPALLVAGA